MGTFGAGATGTEAADENTLSLPRDLSLRVVRGERYILAGFVGLSAPRSVARNVSAALQAGQVTPDTIVNCPGTENIEGRQIPNDDEFELGQVPLHTSVGVSILFRMSCSI